MTPNTNRGAVSSLLPPLLNKHQMGKVHSVFSKGLNLQFGQEYIFISGESLPLSAIGIKLPDELFKGLMDVAGVGDLVVKKNGLIKIYCKSSVINLDTPQHKVIDLRVPRLHFNRRSISKTRLYRHLSTMDLHERTGLSFNEKTRYHIGQLVHSTWLQNDLGDHVNYFIGRGLGLTPSGDDLLSGFAMALKAFSQDRNFTPVLQASLSKKTTTFVSQAYYKALFKDHLSENFIKLIGLLEISDTDEIENTIKDLQSYGHTSGNDTLFGFLLGLKHLLSS